MKRDDNQTVRTAWHASEREPSGAITIGEILAGVNAALTACPTT